MAKVILGDKDMKISTMMQLVAVIVFCIHDATAQGVVFFGNQPLGATRRIFDVDAATPVSGTNFFAQLLYQDRTGTWVTHPNAAPFFDTSFPSTFAGYWRGANRTLVNAGGGSGLPFGEPVNMQVRVWDGGSGTMFPLTFEQAVAGGMKWGISDVFVYIEEFSDPRSNSDFWMWNFQSFSLVPEPSAWALFALGMGWLVWRSRKHRMSDAS